MGSSCQRLAERREAEPDERDPPVSVRVRGRGSARRVRMGRALGPAWAEAKRAGRVTSVFSFSFLFKNAGYLNLCNKSCVDPKIMEFFVQLP